MIFPIRCFTCNKVISQYWERFNERVNKSGEHPKTVLDEFEIKRYCCRRMFLGHVELIDRISAPLHLKEMVSAPLYKGVSMIKNEKE